MKRSKQRVWALHEAASGILSVQRLEHPAGGLYQRFEALVFLDGVFTSEKVSSMGLKSGEY